MHTYFAANGEDGLNLLFIVPFIDVWLIINKGLKNKLHIIYELEKYHIRYCADKNIYKRTGQEILGNIIKNPKYIKNFKIRTKQAADELILFSKSLQKDDLSKLRDQQLVGLINKWVKLFTNMLKYSVGLAIIELSNDLLTEHLGQILENRIKQVKTKTSSSLAAKYVCIIFILSSF